MKTIKCKIVNEVNVSEYLRKYTSVLHIAYKMLRNKHTQPEVKKNVNSKFVGLNSFIIQNAIVQAQALFLTYETRKTNFEKDEKNAGKKFKETIFGGRKNLIRYLKGLISKEEFKQNRLSPMMIAGETRHKGNRLFDFDFENNLVIFKPKKGIKIPIEFKMSNKQKVELLKAQMLCQNRQFSIAVALNNEYVLFCFDEEKLHGTEFFYKDLKDLRIIGIDQNPNYLGVSVLEFDQNNNFKVLHKEVIDISKLTEKSNESSSNKKSKYLVNKRKFETINIAYQIDKLAKYWKTKKIVIEDLHFNQSFSFKHLNRLCKNSWNRYLFEKKLEMLSKLHGYSLVKINACYTSFIGNILHGNKYDCPDMVAASIEIARRGYKKYEKGWFYPNFNKSLNLLNEQWKQTLANNFVEDWKEFYSLIKNLKIKYQVSLENCIFSKVFSLNNQKSRILICELNSF